MDDVLLPLQQIFPFCKTSKMLFVFRQAKVKTIPVNVWISYSNVKATYFVLHSEGHFFQLVQLRTPGYSSYGLEYTCQFLIAVREETLSCSILYIWKVHFAFILKSRIFIMIYVKSHARERKMMMLY